MNRVDQIFVSVTPGDPKSRVSFIGPFLTLRSAVEFAESPEVEAWLRAERNLFGGYPSAQVTTPVSPQEWAVDEEVKELLA